MKIEKLNDNQIRCTLTRADLADRQLKLSELVCGTEKAKSLFQDMMQKAASEFGFEAEDMPLMIEAIPASADCIVLIITKVDDPDELDAKFPKIGNLSGVPSTKKQHILDKLEGAEDILDLINKVKDAVADSPQEKKNTKPSGVRLFSFANMDSVIYACHLLKKMHIGASTLYKEESEQVFILAITQAEKSASDFNKICNMLSEYGSLERVSYATLAYLEEHCETIVATDAVQQLGNI